MTAIQRDTEDEGLVRELARLGRRVSSGLARRWPLVAAFGVVFLLVPGVAGGAKPRFGKVTFSRIASLDEGGEQAQLTLSLDGRIARNGARSLNATLQFRGTVTCMSPGQCSACPGLVLTETAVGTVRAQRTKSRPFQLTPLSKTTYDLRLGASIRVERQRMEFTGEGCNTRTISTTEVWTFATPSAREIAGKPIRKLSGSVSRRLEARLGGHECGLPNGWAFTTCRETLSWKLVR